MNALEFKQTYGYGIKYEQSEHEYFAKQEYVDNVGVQVSAVSLREYPL